MKKNSRIKIPSGSKNYWNWNTKENKVVKAAGGN